MSLVLLPLVTTWLTSFKRALEERPFQKQPPTTELQRSRCESSQQRKPPPPHRFLRDKRLQCLCRAEAPEAELPLARCLWLLERSKAPPLQGSVQLQPTGQSCAQLQTRACCLQGCCPGVPAVLGNPAAALLGVRQPRSSGSLAECPLTSHRRGALGQMVLVPAEASLGLHSASGTSSRGCS